MLWLKAPSIFVRVEVSSTIASVLLVKVPLIKTLLESFKEIARVLPVKSLVMLTLVALLILKAVVEVLIEPAKVDDVRLLKVIPLLVRPRLKVRLSPDAVAVS